MKNLTGKKSIALLLAIVMVFCSFSGFTYYNGLGTAYYESSQKIFNDARFGELIAAHGTNGLEHAYYVEAKPGEDGLMPMVFSGEVRSTYTLSSMIKYAEQQGYKVVAALNGDIFDMSSGTPKGMTMHDGNIITSGYAPDRVVAFDDEGKASVTPVTLSYTLSGTVGYNVKTPETTTQVPVAKTVTEAGIDENGNPTVTERVETVYETQVLEPAGTEYVTKQFSKNIDFFNVPHGGANGLHLYNRHYATSTKTSGQNAEVVIECSDIQLKVNGTIKGTVKSVNANTANTPITENTVVLSTVAGSATYNTLASMVVGSEVEIKVQDIGNGTLSDAKECIGIYYSIAEGGQNVTNGTNLNPRSAFGIKSDGSLVMFEVDGRRASVSKGLGLYDLGNTMISLGCTEAVNLDGGGSSALYVRQPGKDTTASIVSSPSGGSERKVANAILFVYKDSGSSSPRTLNLYPTLTLVMPGASANISAFASNELYEKIGLSSGVMYEVDSRYGTIDASGNFTASLNAEGRAVIRGYSGSMEGTTEIEITKDIVISPSVSKLAINAGEQTDINVTATAGTSGVSIPVKSNDSLFTWSCDENVGTITQEGVFTAASSASAQSGNIYIEYNGKRSVISVQVGADLVIFSDTAEHWAKEYIGVLAGMKIIDGMGDNLFAPDSSLTRAQFVAMLAKMTDGFSSSEIRDAGFTDVPDYEWYYSYVNWAAENGIVSGMGDGRFSPNAQITREQMAVMLCNYAASIGFALPQTSAGASFGDASSISSWSLDYVMTAAGAGIINGFETGEFKPQGTAKRGEAAKVIYKLCEIRGIIK